MLPDINLWIALAFAGHFHHAAAKAWFDALENDPCHFCRLTQQGFLRLATNPRALRNEAVTMDKAWALYDTLRRDPRIAFAEEAPLLEDYWRGHTGHQVYSPRIWNDAYLAAFAQAASLKIVTFDKDFYEYANVDCLVLS